MVGGPIDTYRYGACWRRWPDRARQLGDTGHWAQPRQMVPRQMAPRRQQQLKDQVVEPKSRSPQGDIFGAPG